MLLEWSNFIQMYLGCINSTLLVLIFIMAYRTICSVNSGQVRQGGWGRGQKEKRGASTNFNNNYILVIDYYKQRGKKKKRVNAGAWAYYFVVPLSIKCAKCQMLLVKLVT